MLVYEHEDTRRREIQGLMDTLESYSLDHRYIITLADEENQMIEGCEIFIKPFWKWVLEEF